MEYQVIPPKCGTSFVLTKGQRLVVKDAQGQQVSDLVLVALDDPNEVLSNGKTFEYENTLSPGLGNNLWSNRSRPMVKITGDTCGTHDFILGACCKESFEILYTDSHPSSPSCLENLCKSLSPYGVVKGGVPSPFHIFLGVDCHSNGEILARGPASVPGDTFEIVALFDLVVGLTACSSENDNLGQCKAIHYNVH